MLSIDCQEILDYGPNVEILLNKNSDVKAEGERRGRRSQNCGLISEDEYLSEGQRIFIRERKTVERKGYPRGCSGGIQQRMG